MLGFPPWHRWSSTKGDAPVSGLEAADFKVEDEGVAQQVEVVDRVLLPTTAVLVLDTSASVAGTKLVHLKEEARVFVAGLSPRDEVALVTFSEKMALRQEASRDRAALHAALDHLTARGGTRVIDTLYVCLKRRWGVGRPLVVQAARESSALLHVVGTEAGPAHSRPPTLPGSMGPGATVRALDDTEPGYIYLLRRAAETTGGAYWPVESVTGLSAAFLRILEAANARYVLRYEPTGVLRQGRHRLKVTVRRRGASVRARQEYVASPPE